MTRGAVAGGGEKLFCGGRYSGELKRRSGSRGWIMPGCGVMDWPVCRSLAEGAKNVGVLDSTLPLS